MIRFLLLLETALVITTVLIIACHAVWLGIRAPRAARHLEAARSELAGWLDDPTPGTGDLVRTRQRTIHERIALFVSLAGALTGPSKERMTHLAGDPWAPYPRRTPMPKPFVGAAARRSAAVHRPRRRCGPRTGTSRRSQRGRAGASGPVGGRPPVPGHRGAARAAARRSRDALPLRRAGHTPPPGLGRHAHTAPPPRRRHRAARRHARGRAMVRRRQLPGACVAPAHAPVGRGTRRCARSRPSSFPMCFCIRPGPRSICR